MRSINKAEITAAARTKPNPFESEGREREGERKRPAKRYSKAFHTALGRFIPLYAKTQKRAQTTTDS